MTNSSRHPRLRLRVRPAEEIAEYIRQVRIETLEAIRMEVAPAHIDPLPCGVYLVAEPEDGGRPVGLIESAFLHQVYPNIDALPYRKVFDIDGLCSFEEVAGVRTVYVRPDCRGRQTLYLKLIVAQSRIFHSLGASIATATTDSRNDFLCRLYDRTGGTRLGSFVHPSAPDPIVLFRFSIPDLARHPLGDRFAADPDFAENRATAAALVGARTVGC